MPSQWSAEDNSVPGIHVRGGAHGLTVEYRELESVAGILDQSAAELSSLRSGCREMYMLLCTTSSVHPSARVAAAAADLVLRDLSRNKRDVEEAADDLRRAARNYLEAEGELEKGFAWLAGAPAGFDAWRRGGGGLPGRVESELMVPPFNGLLIEKAMEQLAGRGFGELRPINVTRGEGGQADIELRGTARALLERSKVLLDGPDSGVVEILTVQTGARPVRVVTLPGTQEAGNLLVGPNPFDNYGNAEGRAEDSHFIADAVAESLRLAGASADDAVILVGYSQGGIHAVNVGARLGESGEFSVEMIVTAGAPAGDRSTPDGVKVLHFENYQDWVPGTDGTMNPDTPDRITVTGRTPASAEGSPGGLGPAHDLDLYLELAAQADASHDPSLRDSLGLLAEIIPPASIATRGLFRFSRKPGGPPGPSATSSPASPPSPSPTPSPSPQARPLPPGSGQ